jgi:hypothetical protein
MAYNFDLDITAKNYTVGVDTQRNYGYFENDRTGSGGGLWFEKNADGKLELIDFDGTYELPLTVFNGLQEAGLIIDEIFGAD